jgi:hypothetical protein
MMVFYQALLDAVKSNNQETDLLLLKKLCVALDKKNHWGVHNSVLALIDKKLIINHDFTLLYEMVELHHHEIYARMILMGMGDSFRIFRDWHFGARFRGPSYLSPYSARPSDLGVEMPRWIQKIWQSVINGAMKGNPSSHFKSATETLKSWNLILVGLVIEISYAPKSRPNRMHQLIIPDYLRLVERSIWHIQTIFQLMLELIHIDLAKGNRANVSRLKSLLIELHKNLMVKKQAVNIFSVQMELNRRGEIQLIKMMPGDVFQMTSGGKYLDAPVLEKHAKRREMVYTHYDENGANVGLPGFRIRLGDIFEQFWRQIDFLLLIYGQLTEENPSVKQFEQQYRFRRIIDRPLSKNDEGTTVSGEARLRIENNRRHKILAAIPNKNRLLQNDDDWVEYIVALYKFEISRKTAKNDIWLSVMQDLKNYFGASTTHTKFNLRDFGTSYLTLEKKFPRAITGQQLHDCGVYAVRLSYILLQAENRINAGKTSVDDSAFKLNINFIVLPNHVGLIIRSNDLTPYIIHNSNFNSFSADWLAAREKRWKNFDREGKERQISSINIDEEQFWAEIAAPLFVSGVNVPYLVIKIPSADWRPATTKHRIWEAYKLVVCAPDRKKGKQCGRLFDPHNNEQINLLYLDAIEKELKLYNQYLVRIWNNSWMGTWRKHEKKLTLAFAAAKKKPTSGAKTFLDLKQKFIDEIDSSLSEIQDGLDEISNIKTEIDSKLSASNKILDKGIKHTWHKRLSLESGPLFEWGEYVDSINFDFADSASPIPDELEPPPFSEAKNRLRRTPM